MASDYEYGPQALSELSLCREFIERVNPALVPELALVHADASHTRPLLHISPIPNIPAMTPRVSSRRAPSEDETIPRIPVSSTIIGCMASRQNDISEFFQDRHDERWLGGWYIYRVPYLVYAVPSPKLVSDAQRTGERWILGFNDTHRLIEPRPVGRIFYSEVSYKPSENHGTKSGERIRQHVTMYLELLEPTYLIPQREYLPGHYRIDLNWWQNYTDIDHNDFRDYELTKITEEEFRVRKESVASMLSHDNRSLEW